MSENRRIRLDYYSQVVYAGGEEMFDAVEAAIRGARDEVLLSLFSFEYDRGGRRLIGVLSDAVRRGARVRLVIDAYGSSASHVQVARVLREAGAEVAVFRPVWKWLARPAQAYCRNHARLLLVDRKVFGLGSIVFRDEFRDREDLLALIEVDEAGAIVRVFDRLWRAAEHTRDIDAGPLGEMVAPGVTLMASGPNIYAKEIYRWALTGCRSARKRIRIATPFFFPPRRLLGALRAASRRGVSVEVITPLCTDRPGYDSLRAMPMPWLLSHHAAAWFSTPSYFHSKFCLIDDRWTLGSANFDVIAMKRNFELNIHGRGGATLTDLEACFSRLRASAQPMAADQVPPLLRFLPDTFQRFAEYVFALT